MPKKLEDYRACMSQGLRGKKGLSKEERKRLFCEESRLCSGKASSREEAEQICKVSMSQPKEPKARKRRAARPADNGGGMRVVLLTTTGCKPCSAAKDFLKDQLESGEIEELNLQKSNEAADLVAKHGFKGVPKLLVLRADGTPFSELQITETEMMIESQP